MAGDVVALDDIRRIGVAGVDTQGWQPSPGDTISTGGGSGGGSGVTIDVKEYVDAKTEAVRAQNGEQTARLESKLDIIHNELLGLPRIWTLIATVASAPAVGVVIIISVLAFAGDRFDGGVQLSSAYAETAIDGERLGRENARQIKELVAELRAQRELLADFLSSREVPPPN